MRGATGRLVGRRLLRQISIHAPHARGDSVGQRSGSPCSDFNPRPSCEGRRGVVDDRRREREISIHAPHARGDDQESGMWYVHLISIHAPHARGDTDSMRASGRVERISIHAPHARGDAAWTSSSATPLDFNPRPSCEGRQCVTGLSPTTMDFNPRPSCEGRRPAGTRRTWRSVFQSTPLMRGATSMVMTAVPSR